MATRQDNSWRKMGEGRIPHTIGYHTVWLTANQMVKTDKAGNITIIGPRGKIIETGLNYKTPPPTYFGKVLTGDIKEINQIDMSKYSSKTGPLPFEVKEVFRTWKLFAKSPFKKGGKVGSILTYEHQLKHFKMTLVALCPQPTKLLCIRYSGINYYEEKGINEDIPVTSLYVNEVVKAKNGLYALNAEERKRKAELETSPVEDDDEEWRNKNWSSLLRWQKKQLEKELQAEAEAAKRDLKQGKRGGLSNADSVKIMIGLPPKEESGDIPYTKPLSRREATERAKAFLATHPLKKVTE